ncbi:MAG: site-specific integrase [Desulfobacteraceae bacterium]|nr:site-specific integrase [Desulfobacteraceae bacterium]
MAEKWFNSSFKNVQYKKHPTRKHGVKFDKYFRGSYQVSGIRKAVNFGWQSEGWTEEDVFNKINLYKMNAKTGTGPLSLKDERAIQEAKNAEIEKVQAQIKKSNMTFKDFFHEIYLPLIKKEKKRKTYSREESLFRNWMEPNIGMKFFNEISKADIENIFYDIVDESGKSIRTAEYALTTLKQIWREAKAGGYAPDMPVISKTLKKRISQNNNARMRFLSYSEAETLMDELKKHSLSLYEKALISLHCGLRASEVFKLSWSQVDLEHGILNIINSKGKDRSVHMSEQLKEMMQLKTKGKPNELVWPGRENKISGQISQVFRKVADQLFNKDITDRRERVTFHSLRHTCASWMVMQGISLYLVQKVLGHSTIQVTERYAHLAPDQLSLAAGAINRGLMEHKEKNIIPFKQKA